MMFILMGKFLTLAVRCRRRGMEMGVKQLFEGMVVVDLVKQSKGNLSTKAVVAGVLRARGGVMYVRH